MCADVHAIGRHIEKHRTVIDRPIHARFANPALQRLVGRELVAQTMPRGVTNKCHGFDKMSHFQIPPDE